MHIPNPRNRSLMPYGTLTSSTTVPCLVSISSPSVPHACSLWSTSNPSIQRRSMRPSTSPRWQQFMRGIQTCMAR